MRTNGYISVLMASGASLNDYGEVEIAEAEWTDQVPCNIKTNNDTRKGKYEGGEYREASYTILVEGRISQSVNRCRIERLDEDLGEFEIQSIEIVPGMGRTQIVV